MVMFKGKTHDASILLGLMPIIIRWKRHAVPTGHLAVLEFFLILVLLIEDT